MKIIETDTDVLVIPIWMIEKMGNLNGELVHPTSSAKLKALEDPDGDFILGMSVLTDPDWGFLEYVETPKCEQHLIRDVLGKKKYKYYQEDVI